MKEKFKEIFAGFQTAYGQYQKGERGENGKQKGKAFIVRKPVTDNLWEDHLNGDIIDFYAISRFEKDPRKRNFGHEVLMTRQFLHTLRKLFPNAAIYYKCGNHDVRYDHYIMRNAPDLLGMNEFSFESLMNGNPLK